MDIQQKNLQNKMQYSSVSMIYNLKIINITNRYCISLYNGGLLPGTFLFAPFYTIWDIGKIMSYTLLHTKSRSLINILFFRLVYFVKFFKDFLCSINAV